MRNFRKLKTLDDYAVLDAPEPVANGMDAPEPPFASFYILRMLVRAKYGVFRIPPVLKFLDSTIKMFSGYDRAMTEIQHSWCYVTVRHGPVESETDDEWHFDGSSFRTDITPERNYIWVSRDATEYKLGNLRFPPEFDPIRHNLFTFAAEQLRDAPVHTCDPRTWYLLSPFCLHRRPPMRKPRTFYRICFTDIEGRDVNNTPNPLLPTDAFGRDPVRTFRDRLEHFDV